MNELSIYDRFEKPGQVIDQLGKAIFNSQMFGAENIYQGQILALECASRRSPPMTLTERYHIIHGRLTMKSDAMLADLRARGGTHRIVERSPERAAVEITLDGQSCMFALTWDEARQEPFVYVGKESTVVQKLEAGKTDDLVVKNKYATPRSRSQMLWARVVSDGVRAMAPEVVAGYYTPEEVTDVVESAPVDVQPTEKARDIRAFETASENQGEEASEPVTDASARPRGNGVTLEAGTGGTAEEAHEQGPYDPCGTTMANDILDLAAKVGLPDSKLDEVVQRSGAARLVDMPYQDAARLRQKLAEKLSEQEIPF